MTAPTTTTTSGGTGPGELVEPTSRVSVRNTLAASFGTIIEWYDYGLYGIVAGLVIAPLFFPMATGAVGLLATLATFSVGFVARPIGGIVLGALSDRWGRRPVLILSIVLIGIATFLIGLLPGYATIGVWAPILLVTLRVLQGFGAGAELAGAITFLNESSGRRRRGWLSSFSMAAGLGGSILSTLFFTALSAGLAPDAFTQWGWRIPFLCSAVLTVVGLLLRRGMIESPEFTRLEALRAAGELPPARRNPFVAFGTSIAASPRNWLSGFLLASGLNATGFVALTYGVSYLSNTVKLPREQALTVNFVMLVVGALVCLFWGRVTDRIGARRVMIIGIVGGILLAYPYVLLLQLGNFPAIAAMSGLLYAFAWSAGSAAHTVLMPALFKPEFRAAGLFSSRELQGALIAGPAPFIAAALVAASGGSVWVLVGVIAVSQLLSLVGVLVGRPWVSAAELAETPALTGLAVRD